jgi:hypothetical protein
MAMGGAKYGMQGPSLINPANPASYAGFDSTAFVFQGGIFGTSVNLKTTSFSENGNYISLSHLVLGFQITKWWKTSLGVLPYSYVGYDVFAEEEIENVGQAKFIYQGSGGLNKMYWGNSFTIFEGFSVGFNFAYLFGRIYHEQGVTFPENLYLKNTRVQTSFTANDFFFNFGAQYRKAIGKKYHLTSGVAYSPSTSMKSRDNFLATTYFGDINSVSIFRDTVVETLNSAETFIKPATFGVGFSFEEFDHWTVAADFNFEKWTDFKLFDRPDSLQNSWHIAMGGEYIPNVNTVRSYWERVNYRFGFRYGQTYLNLRETSIDEFGISFGLGLPIRRSRTTLNFAAEIGKRGTTRNDLIQENFVRFTFSVNVNEKWFVKSKYY